MAQLWPWPAHRPPVLPPVESGPVEPVVLVEPPVVEVVPGSPVDEDEDEDEDVLVVLAVVEVEDV
jgi:hypothetical protein